MTLRPNSPGDGNSVNMATKKAYHKCDKLFFNLIQLRYKLKLNKIAARWPAKAVAQFSTSSKKGSDKIVPK